MHAPSGNLHADFYKRGPKAGDQFDFMGIQYVIEEVDFKTGALKYRVIGQGRNINENNASGLDDLFAGF